MESEEPVEKEDDEGKGEEPDEDGESKKRSGSDPPGGSSSSSSSSPDPSYDPSGDSDGWRRRRREKQNKNTGGKGHTDKNQELRGLPKVEAPAYPTMATLEQYRHSLYERILVCAQGKEDNDVPKRVREVEKGACHG